jgi:excinuclease ABC subunit A
VADQLIIRGAREHNLKDVSIDLPRDALIVFTGLSGSGKSSLAFDTIFAEGQRRYVESLSAYARQFLGQMDKPDVDFIEGLSPAVSIDQKSTSRNPRSTVGTITEVYDYLRLLYARAGRPHCPTCGAKIERQTPQQIVDRVLTLEEGRRFQVLAPVIRGRKGEYVELFSQLQTQGFSRVRVDGETHSLDAPPTLDKKLKHTIEVVVDRLAVKESAKRRLTDSVETALTLSGGLVDGGRRRAGRPQPLGDARRGRHPAVVARPRQRLLPAAAGCPGRRGRVRPQHALGGAPGQSAALDPRRARQQGPRRHPQPLRP